MKLLGELSAMDVIEVFSPERVNKQVERFGMRRGVAVDLQEMKPDGSRHWDLDLDEDYHELFDLIAKKQPLLVISSPPCTTFSPLRRISNTKRNKDTVKFEEELGRQRLHRALQCCKLQKELGGYFLREHPKGSSSWDLKEVCDFVEQEDHYLVQSPMCRFGMKLHDDRGDLLHVRKETLWLTNCQAMAEELRGACENKLRGEVVHRHVQLIGGQRAHAAQLRPTTLSRWTMRRQSLRARSTWTTHREPFWIPSWCEKGEPKNSSGFGRKRCTSVSHSVKARGRSYKSSGWT